MKILIIIIFLPVLLSAQTPGPIEAYFTSINKAESQIMIENWDNAVVAYERAFNQSADPFFTDVVNYLNSLLLSDVSESKKNHKLTYWLNYLINEKRVNWDYLEDILFPNSVLAEFKKQHFFTEERDSVEMITDSIILQIFNDDQNIRPKNFRSKEDKISIDSMDQINWKRFNEFIDRYGFPCEHNLSHSLGEYKLWEVVSLLLRHFVQIGYGEEVIDVLQREFQTLKIPRNILASVYDLEYHMSRGKKTHYQYVTSYIVFIGTNIYKPLIDYSEESLALINKNRSGIHLPELEISIMNSVCKTMCVEGKVKRFFIEPYVAFDELPEFLFDTEEDKEFLARMKIDPSQFVNHCPCEKF